MSLFFWDFSQVRYSTAYGGSLPRRQRVRIEGYQGTDTGDEIILSTGMVNVKDYGAVGDGVTDDTSAVLAASAKAITQGKRLYFQSGTYTVKTTIPVGGDLEVVGDSLSSSIINGGADRASPVFEVTSVTGVPRHFCMRNLTVSGGGVQVYVHPWILSRTSVFENVTFYDFHRKGLHIETEAVSIKLRNLNFVAGSDAPGFSTYGLYASGVAVLHYADVDGIRATQCTGRGVWIGDTGPAQSAGSMGTCVKNVVLEANPGGGMYVKSAGLVMVNPFFEINSNNTGYADLEIDTNYSAGQVTYSRVELYSPSFLNATTPQLSAGKYKRIEFKNQGIRFACYNLFQADSYPNYLEAGSNAISYVAFRESRMEVRTLFGQHTQLLEAGHASFGRYAAEGSAYTDTGISVYGGTYGGVAKVIASRHVGAVSPTTEVAEYLIRYSYDGGSGVFNAKYQDGDSNFVTFALTASGTIKFKSSDNTNCAITVLSGASS